MAPFTNEECRHGTHARPELTPAQVRATAPAEGALILLPFGLSCRACDDQGAALVDGCTECVLLDEGDVCGGCRRVWIGDHPQPASQLPQVGLPLELEEWRCAVGLEEHLPGSGETEEPEEEDYEEEEWGEEEWEAEGEEEEHAWEDEWASAEEGDYDASWSAKGDGGYGGGGDGWQSRSGPAAAVNDGWGAGRWIQDRWGNWEWTVDFASSAAASAVPAADAPALEVAAVAASQLVSAAVQAVLAVGAAPAAPVAASSPGASERVRILELQLELEQLKRQRLA